MPRQLLTAFLAAVFALMASACSPGTDADNITSVLVDERTVLEIPDGALPDGVSIDDLRVVAGSGALFEAVEGGPEPLASYRLEPTGLTFLKPLTLRVDVPLDDVPADVITFLRTEGQEAPELVHTRLEDRDENAGTVALVTELSHFSDIVHYPAEPFFVHIELPRRAMVGQPFKAQVTIRGNLNVLVRAPWAANFLVQVAMDQPWSLEGHFLGFEPVSPDGFIDDRPSRTSVTGTRFEVEETFVCERAGEAQVFYRAAIDYHVRLIRIDLATGVRESEITFELEAGAFKTEALDCIAPVSQADPSPTAGVVQDGSQSTDDGPTITKSVVTVDGEQYPLDFLNPHNPVDGDCVEEHFHTSSPAFPLNPEAPPINDPRPGGCGLGTYSDIIQIEVPADQWWAFMDRTIAAIDGSSGGGGGGGESIGVDVVVVDGERFPIEQFELASRDSCDREHYHSSLASFSLEGGTLLDPRPSGCGFGTVDDVTFVEVSADDWARYRERLAGN